MTTDRTTLALAACQGLTNEELAKRGPGGYLKMRDRKRSYATAARVLATGMDAADLKIAQLQAELEAAKKKIAALEQIDAPVTDTTQAASVLAGIMGGK